MNSISDTTKSATRTIVQFLNQQLVKESIKKIVGSVTFAFGLVEIYDVCQILKGREISTEACSNDPKWMQIANKIIIVLAKISIIFSAATSPPGVFLISSLMGCFFSTDQLSGVFGPYTVFAINPWHPRHIASIAAVIFALPSVVQSVFIGVQWAHKTLLHNGLTDNKVRLMAIFNTATSRPVLHFGNRILHMV